MPRMARVVVPGIPHHVTQRGNRRQPVFFCDEDYVAYRNLIAQSSKAAGVEVWAYCLMPNHVHMILVPSDEDGLRAALADAHRRYSKYVNRREGWTGYLWQGRFASAAMDESHLLACARYVEQNPVRAHLAGRPQDWAWSSARAHLTGRDDQLVSVAPLLDRIDDWAGFLDVELGPCEHQAIRSAEGTGRPLGPKDFLDRLEAQTGRRLVKMKAGRKPVPPVA